MDFPKLPKFKDSKRRLTVLTAGDAILTRLIESAGIDLILVGDSLANTLLGHPNTRGVNMSDMLHHVKAVTRVRRRCPVIADMPWRSYESSLSQAVRNAVRFLRQGKADAVKLEGGVAQHKTIRAIVRAGIPVMGHIGLLPQSVTSPEGYKVRGKSTEEIRLLKDDLKAVEDAGAFACVLEYIRAPVAATLTRQTKLPTIGIGSGPDCDGQVLVTTDMLGLQSHFQPRAVRRYLQLEETIVQAIERYKKDVQTGRFPSKMESFK